MLGAIYFLLQRIEDLCHKILRQLYLLSQQEDAMSAKLDKALADFDAEISSIATDISDLSTRLAKMDPGAEADAVADQINTRVANLKTTADALKTVGTTTSTTTPDPGADAGAAPVTPTP